MNVSKMAVAAIVLVTLAGGGWYLLQSSDDDAAMPAMSSMPRYLAGELEVGITTIPATPRVGDNRLIIELRKQNGEPVSGAAIGAYAEMPAMGAMQAMRAPADMQETTPGRYEGEVNLSMRGEWPLTLGVQVPGGAEQRLQFDLATDRAGLPIAAGGTPVGGMAPVASANDDNVITIDNRRRQLIGVKTGLATHRDLVKTIRAVGEVAYDERRLSQVTLKFDGYIGDLQADSVGAQIEAGQTLFTVYSPELLAAQQEYLEVWKRRSNDNLLRATQQRLTLWDMSDAQIRALEARGEPRDYIAIHAARSGTLIERNIADGGAARAGEVLLTIVDLSDVWVEAQVFEEDLGLVSPGMQAEVALPYLPGQRYRATIDYVYPWLDGQQRTGRVRLSLANPDGLLKPGMYAEVGLMVDIGHRLSVPEEAIIVAGDSRVVFVDLDGGRLRPAKIETGRRAQGFVEVLDGLSLGDRVVTSGNFLISAETRLKTGIDQW